MLVHPQFDPVALHIGPINIAGIVIGPFAIRWYGLMYLLGFILFVVLGRKRARQNLLTGWHPRDIDDMLFYGVLGVILGGRLGYVLFYKPLYYLVHPLEIFQVWQGGMSFHGGFLGVLIGLWFYARKRRRLGEVSGAFLVGYGTLRFIAEYFREPDQFLGLLALGMSMGQWLCVPMVLAGIALWSWGHRQPSLQATPQA